jgi:hypothetical protein
VRDVLLLRKREGIVRLVGAMHPKSANWALVGTEGGRLRKPNPIFARGESRRPAIDILRDGGKPLAIRDMTLGALRAKGVRIPDRRAMKTTRTKLRETFGKPQARGVARTVGAGKVTRRRWHRKKSGRLAAWEARPRPRLLRGTLNQSGGDG